MRVWVVATTVNEFYGEAVFVSTSQREAEEYARRHCDYDCVGATTTVRELEVNET